MFRRALYFRDSLNPQSRNWGFRDSQIGQSSLSGRILSKDYDYHDIDRGMENYCRVFSENKSKINILGLKESVK